MVLVAGAVCPHPPLLVPEVAGDAGEVLAAVRAACAAALTRVLAQRPDVVVVVGDGPTTGELPASAGAGFGAFGVDVVVRPPGDGYHGDPLPLSLTVATWLLDRAGHRGARILVGLARDLAPDEAKRLGAALAGSAARVAVVAMGDGCARREESSPGWVDPRGRRYDDEVARAVAQADVEALGGLDPAAAAELWVAGRAAWQVLAGAATGRTAIAAVLHDSSAPLGVGYHVASWVPVTDGEQ